MIPYPIGPFEPDRPKYAPNATTWAVNCLPTKDGWGPKPDIVAISEALAGECLGATYVRSSTGSFDIIAGTRTGLYRLDPTDYTWTNISQGGATPYNVPVGDSWTFVPWGTKLVALNLTDDPQVYDVDAGTAFADLAGSPPKAKYGWVAGEFLVLGHIASFPNRIRWCQIGNIEAWEVGVRGADFQDFPDGEDVMGGIGSSNGAVVFQRRKIRSMVVTQNADFVFQIDVLNPDRGVIAPLSIASIGANMFAYRSEDGFFMGVEGTAIGAERVDRWVLEQADTEYIPDMKGVADPFRKIFWWQIQKSDGTKFLLGYNWQLDKWCYAENNVSTMTVATTIGISWDGLDDLYATIDDVDLPYDSRLFTGGRPEFAAFTNDNRLGFFSGGAMQATIEGPSVSLVPPERCFVQGAKVLTDAASFTLQIGTQDNYQDDVTWGTAQSPYTGTGQCHFRSGAKLHRFRAIIPAGTSWTNLAGLDVDAVREGSR